MAIYQFSMNVVPHDCKEMDFDGNVWKKSSLNTPTFVTNILEELQASFGGGNTQYSQTFIFGKEDGVLINFLVDQQGLLETIYIRIHVSFLKESLVDIQKVVHIFSKYDVSIWTDNFSKIACDYEQILQQIEISRAYQFVLDPEVFLSEQKNWFH